jgi:peptidoglycan biosynthesis protein MviN/MurJ (putative lipid II flippase)
MVPDVDGEGVLHSHFIPTMKEVTKQKRKKKKKKRNMGVSFRLAFVFSARVVTALFYFEIVYIPAGLVDDVVRWLARKNK